MDGDPAIFARSYEQAESYVDPNRPAQLRATPYVWREPESIPPRDWLYGRQLLRGHVGSTIAPGSAGKTTLLMGMALALVTGRDLLGKTVWGGPKRVWIWNLEDSAEEMARLIQAGCKHWNISKDELAGRLFVDSALDGSSFSIAASTTADGLVINRPLVAELTAELVEREIDFLSVDPLVSAHSVNENDNSEIDAVVKEFAKVAHASRTAINLSHHTSKAGATETTALAARGAVALINGCRSVLTINRMAEDEADRFQIEGDERRRYFRTYDDKNNRAPPAAESDWYRLLSVPLCNGGLTGGDQVAVVVPWLPPDPFEGLSGADLLKVQSTIAEGRWRDHHTADNWVGIAVAKALGLDADGKGDRKRILALLRTWKREGALQVVEGKDERRKPVKFVEVGRWQNDPSAPVA